MFYTQSGVGILYLVRVLYSARSPHFIPTPCFILSSESAFYTKSVFYTQSAVRGPQSVFYTDRDNNNSGNNVFHKLELMVRNKKADQK